MICLLCYKKLFSIDWGFIFSNNKKNKNIIMVCCYGENSLNFIDELVLNKFDLKNFMG